MAGLKRCGWLVAALLMAMAIGCSGVLFESKREDGNVERLRLEGGGGNWDTFDYKPREPFKEGRKLDETSVFLKKETSF
jgi:hypothetical protein